MAMTKFMPVVTALIALAAAIFGAGIGVYYAPDLERYKKVLELRVNASKDFLEGQAILQEARQAEAEKRPKEAEELHSRYRQKVKSARFSLGVYSEGPVVNALAKYFRTADLQIQDPTLRMPPCAETWRDDVAVYLAMRQQFLGEKEASHVNEANLYLVLFICKTATG